ncbi:MAG: hypothetical protein CL853_01540 [Crocinitomicaceae bacterium]|nr:hypothetical protein [Crocinitomicaceae bacterium]|tara:strand:- start:6465 stop:7397 length:933 start_codon:yes stop_codon:yes gene_type:complete
MRLLIYISIASIVLSSCDYVENPIPVSTGDFDWSLYPYDTASTPYPYDLNNPESNWTANTNTDRNILLEDYTGHYCTSCPAAADSAKSIEDAYPNRVFVASLHASTNGFFQRVEAPEFTTDYTTTAGTAYCTEIPNFGGNPTGTVNRFSESPTYNNHWYFDDEWRGAVNDQIANAPLLANLQLKYNYYEQTNGLFIHTESELKSNLSGNYSLVIYLIRETCVSAQEFSTGVDHHYHHHAVLSNNINGTWGTSIVNGNATNGDKFYNDFSYQLPDPSTDSTYNVDNLSLITYLCDRNSFEIIQVIKTELNP